MKSLLGYTDRLTVRPGESIDFKVSSQIKGNYEAQLVRLINADSQSTSSNFKEELINAQVNGQYPSQQQEIAPGSYIAIDDSSALDNLSSFTLSFRFKSTLPGFSKQQLLGRWNEAEQEGWGVQLDENGYMSFVSSSHGKSLKISIDQVVPYNEWVQATLKVDTSKNTVQIYWSQIVQSSFQSVGKKLHWEAEGALSHELNHTAAPFIMAAAYSGNLTSGRIRPGLCYSGRLEEPYIYSCILNDEEVIAANNGVRSPELNAWLEADWDFTKGIGTTTISDLSVNRLHGKTYNLPVRAVKASNWNGEYHDWKHCPSQYNAIHFHDDDLYDCGWETDFTYHVDDDLKSGIYAMRLRQGETEEYLPFFVAAKRDKPQAKLAFLVPTFTYMAYANNHLMENLRNMVGADKHTSHKFMGSPGIDVYDTEMCDNYEVGRSTYDLHSDGSPVHHSSWLRPILNMRPKTTLWTFCADLLFVDWLEKKNIDYDIITDDLLQEEGIDLLSNYHVIMTGNHPEYPTTEHMDAIQAYMDQGGRFMYMGGNGFYWRSAVHKELPGVIEVRRGRVGTCPWKSEIGEVVMAFSGEQGALWKENGRPPQQLFGVGFVAQGYGPSYYRVLDEARESRAGFILEGVSNEIIGDYGIFGGAAGEEIDHTNPAYGTPPHTIVLARSENHGPGMLYVLEEMNMTYPLEAYKPLIYAEVAFFETPNGGAMFTVGSMTWCGSLSHNNYENDVSIMTQNVINRFIDSTPFELPNVS
ncbi:N,N-dimethylformamidase [Maricurvus nonylphenolicus]|uniref:N,N-dimethylformamidase beta subunit family domain-containing protein n=1 Tax=Maricurvus nonylphenolicus TaxID=1008307 RepID=UPI0036F1FA93